MPILDFCKAANMDDYCWVILNVCCIQAVQLLCLKACKHRGIKMVYQKDT